MIRIKIVLKCGGATLMHKFLLSTSAADVPIWRQTNISIQMRKNFLHFLRGCQNPIKLWKNIFHTFSLLNFNAEKCLDKKVFLLMQFPLFKRVFNAFEISLSLKNCRDLLSLRWPFVILLSKLTQRTRSHIHSLSQWRKNCRKWPRYRIFELPQSCGNLTRTRKLANGSKGALNYKLLHELGLGLV